MKRDSSPPEAIFASVPNGAPGFVATSKCTRSVPCSPQSASASGVSTVRNRALSSRSGASSAATAASRRRGGPLARRRDGRGRGDVAGARRRRFLFEHGDALGAAFDRGQPLRHRRAQTPADRRPPPNACGPARALRTAAPRPLRARADRVRGRARRRSARPAPRRSPGRRARPPRRRCRAGPAPGRGRVRAGARRAPAPAAPRPRPRSRRSPRSIASPSRSAFCSSARRAPSRSSSSPSGASASISA